MSQQHVSLLTIASFVENPHLMASVKPCSCFYSYISFADSPSSAPVFNADIPQSSLHTVYFLFQQSSKLTASTIYMSTFLNILFPIQICPLS